ncbi:hypothetical protein [Kaistia adipata]|uniref:hypothetical protein n=1 Tax=Kaistia adipata TaxID=166954 RepID=UPI00048FE804|nr:hypothetical protein [Kaistia adipata]
MAAIAGRQLSLLDCRQDGADDESEILGQREGDDGLQVERVLAGLARTEVAIVVALEGHADQVRHRIGQPLGEFGLVGGRRDADVLHQVDRGSRGDLIGFPVGDLSMLRAPGSGKPPICRARSVAIHGVALEPVLDAERGGTAHAEAEWVFLGAAGLERNRACGEEVDPGSIGDADHVGALVLGRLSGTDRCGFAPPGSDRGLAVVPIVRPDPSRSAG